MNNKISNPKTEVPSGINLNDKDYLNDLLSCLKCMAKDFTIAKTEASNEVLFNKYKEMCEEIASLQRSAYELSFRNGWYEFEKAESNKISEKLNMLQTELDDLNQSA